MLVAFVLVGCGRDDARRVDVGPPRETTAQVELVRLRLVAQLEADRSAGAASAAEVARLTAEVARLTAEGDRTAAVARTGASRGTRRLSSTSGSCATWTPLLAAYPWDLARAARVVWCESRCNPNARNASGHNGLLQIAGGPFDPAANVRLGYSMYAARGWQPWAPSRGCWG